MRLSKTRFIPIVGLVFICVAIYLILFGTTTTSPKTWSDLDRDGVRLHKSVISPDKIQKWKKLCENRQYKELKAAMHSDDKLRLVVDSISTDSPEKRRMSFSGESSKSYARSSLRTSSQYILQDYIWIIEKSSVHTCHRDNNGTFFNAGQKHHSYTMLVYLESMDKCLGVIPGSHTSQYKNALNITDNVTDIVCSAGDVIVFNANLIHVGTLVDKDDNLRVQMKISHPDDIEVLGYYQNFNKVLNKENSNPRLLRQMQRSTTCTFPFLSDLTQTENIKTARGSSDGAQISDMQKWFSYLFYGRHDFYDLPNAF